MNRTRYDDDAVLRARLEEARERDEAMRDDDDTMSFLPVLFAALAVALMINAAITLLPA